MFSRNTQPGTLSKAKCVWKFGCSSWYPKAVRTVLTSCSREKNWASHLSCSKLALPKKGWPYAHWIWPLCSVRPLQPWNFLFLFVFWFKIMVTTVSLQSDTESTGLKARSDIWARRTAWGTTKQLSWEEKPEWCWVRTELITNKP